MAAKPGLLQTVVTTTTRAWPVLDRRRRGGPAGRGQCMGTRRPTRREGLYAWYLELAVMAPASSEPGAGFPAAFGQPGGGYCCSPGDADGSDIGSLTGDPRHGPPVPLHRCLAGSPGRIAPEPSRHHPAGQKGAARDGRRHLIRFMDAVGQGFRPEGSIPASSRSVCSAPREITR